MEIASYNVNSIRARMELLLQWLDHRGGGPDVLCLQELKTAEENFPFERFQALGYHSALFSQPQYNGVAICSKRKPLAIRRGFGSAPLDDQKRLIACRFDEYTVINAYVPHGDLRGEEKYRYKLRWYGDLLEYLLLHHRPEEPLLLAGDFNVAAADRDLYDAALLADSVGTMPEERDALDRLLQWGLSDTFRHLHPEKKQFTWWSYLDGAIWKDQGMRIDYIFCTKPLIGRLTEAQVDLWPRRRRKPTPSDHAPVIAGFSAM